MIRFTLLLVTLMATGCVSNPDDRIFDDHLLKDADRELLMEQYLAAAGHYEAFLAENPQLKDKERARIHLLSGRAYLGAGRVEQAVLTFDQALGESPSPDVRWEILFRRAIAFLRRGEAPRAVDEFRSVAGAPSMERGGSITSDEFHFQFALALFRVGDWKGGQAELALVSPNGAFRREIRTRLGLTSFTVQVGVYQDEPRARTESDKIRGMVRVIPGEKHPLYLVTWGSFPKFEDAQREAERLKRQYPDAFVLP